MGTTAQKGAYLLNTKSLLKDKINALGGDIDDETTFREYANQLDAIYEHLPKTSFEEGETITLENTLKGKLNFQDNIAGIGQAEQKTTQGYNLLPMDTPAAFEFVDNYYINNTSAGYFLTNGIQLRAGVTYYSKIILYTKPVGSTSFSYYKGTDITSPITGWGHGNIQGYNLNQVYTSSFTPTEDMTMTIRTWGNANNEKYKFQLWITTDNSKDTFEPYTNGASPSPNWEQEIKYVRGRNLVESKNVKSITTGYSDVLFTQADLKPNTTYTISFEGVTGNKIYANENLFILKYMTIPSGRASLVVTTKATISKSTRTQYQEENGGWLIFKNNGDGNPTANIFDNLQIEEGTEATPFKPFNTITETVSGENKFNLKGWINTLASQSNPIGSGTLDSYTDNSITITSTGNDCYTRSFTMGTASVNKELYLNNPDFFIEVEPNTEYTLSFVRSNSSIPARPMLFYLDKDFNYLSLVDPGALSIDKLTNTTPSNAKYLTMRIGMINSSGQTLTISNIMYVKGTSTSYIPYIAPKNYQFSLGNYKFYSIPNTNYKDTIRRSNGKNKFIGSLYNGIINSTGGYASNPTRICNSNTGTDSQIYLEKGTYTLSIAGLNQCSVITKDTNGNIVDNFATYWHNLPFTFTLTSDAYVYFSAKKDDTNNLTPSDYLPQIEQGSTATDYEPYGVGVWYKYGEVGEILLDGTNQSFSGKSGFTTNHVFFTLPISDILAPPNNDTDVNMLSNYFLHCKINALASNRIGFGCRSDKMLGFGFTLESQLDTLEKANTWLTTHNIDVLYPLSNPTIDIITGTLAEQLEAWWNGQSFDDTTIIEGDGDLPMLINVRALKGAA